MAASVELRRVEQGASLERVIAVVNTIVDRDLGNDGGRVQLYGYDGTRRQPVGMNGVAAGAVTSSGNYTHDVHSAHASGLLAAFRLPATTKAAAPTVANCAALIQALGLVVGAGKAVRIYAADATDYLSLTSDADGGMSLGGSGVNAGLLTVSKLVTPTIGPSSTQQHTLPAVTSDTVALLAATQTLSGKLVRHQDGTVAAPSVAFDGSHTGTGLYRVTTSTGRIGVACDGTQVAEFVNNGSTFGLGIGLSPSVPLDVQRSSTDYVARIDQASSSAGAKVLYLKSAATGATDELLRVESNSVARLLVEGSGAVLVGDTTNADVTMGLTINQAGNDDQILAFKSSDVAHGMTSVAETDTYAYAQKLQAAAGGLTLTALDGTNTTAMLLRGYAGATSGTRSNGAVAPIILQSSLKSGTSVGSLGADKNLLCVRDATTARFFLDSDGDSHQDVGTAWTNFDDHDDLTVLNSLSHELARTGNPIGEAFGEFLALNRPMLESLGLVQFNDAPGEDGRAFVNMSKLLMVAVGAIRQVGLDVRALRNDMAALTAAN